MPNWGRNLVKGKGDNRDYLIRLLGEVEPTLRHVAESTGRIWRLADDAMNRDSGPEVDALLSAVSEILDRHREYACRAREMSRFWGIHGRVASARERVHPRGRIPDEMTEIFNRLMAAHMTYLDATTVDVRAIVEAIRCNPNPVGPTLVRLKAVVEAMEEMKSMLAEDQMNIDRMAKKTRKTAGISRRRH